MWKVGFGIGMANCTQECQPDEEFWNWDSPSDCPNGRAHGPCVEEDSEATALGPYMLPLLLSAPMVTLAKGSHPCRKQSSTASAASATGTGAYGRMHARHLLFCFKPAGRTRVWKWYIVMLWVLESSVLPGCLCWDFLAVHRECLRVCESVLRGGRPAVSPSQPCSPSSPQQAISYHANFFIK